MNLDKEQVREIVRRALEEDIGSGDVTTNIVVPKEAKALGVITSKEDGVLCGIDVARIVFEEIDAGLEFEKQMNDGDPLSYGAVCARLRGCARSCLTGERVALNLLQRMSGVSTLTARYVKAVEGTGAVIMDTRKTMPGLRILDKYAVRVGGGQNHRYGLYDMVLIKTNHIEPAGGVKAAVKRVKEANGGGMKIEVEVSSLRDLRVALDAGVDRVMLDNMRTEDIAAAVEITGSGVELEASGGINLENVRKVAGTGVDFISVGALTHSAAAIDMSLRLRQIGG
ncbi:MAG: carboxylating nicotinate-nucleotide diphosphorylase [bacterium]